MKPIRVQLSRRKGWRMPADTVRVCRPTRWGNPFPVEDVGRPRSMALYRDWIAQQMRDGHLDPAELRGRNLACWCRLDEACHADQLLALANPDGENS